MAQVVVRVNYQDVVHEFAHNSDAYFQAAVWNGEGLKAYVVPNPEVGMGMTLHYPQDSYPFVITRVSPSGKTVWVKPLEPVSKSTGHEPDHMEGPFPVWSHTYTPDELVSMVRADAPERMVRKTKHGWSSHGTPYGLGQARYHRNYSF